MPFVESASVVEINNDRPIHSLPCEFLSQCGPMRLLLSELGKFAGRTVTCVLMAYAALDDGPGLVVGGNAE